MTDSEGEGPGIDGLDSARFECVFPTCGGICCKQGRPPLETAEALRVQENLAKILPRLRPLARKRVESEGFLTHRLKEGLRSLAVVDGWCVFHNDGCVLHALGAEEGDRFMYKPWRCVAFPLEKRKDGTWFVRQWGLEGEAWDLFCLDPAESELPAGVALKAEVEFVRALDHGRERWRFE